MKCWYSYVQSCICFQAFPFSFYDLLEQSLPFYNMLRRHVRHTSSLLKSPLPVPDLPVPENEKLLAWVGDEIVPRESAKVLNHGTIIDLLFIDFPLWALMHRYIRFLILSLRDVYQVSVFDSVVQGGDAVWEGLRVYSGKIFKLEEHLDRLVKLNA